MTIREAIEEIDVLRKGNQIPENMKMRWLSMLDTRAHNEIFSQHVPIPERFSGYDIATSWDQELLIPFPYDEVYGLYLCMKIDEAEKESLHYNISAEKFNRAYQAFMDRYNKTHKPVYGGAGFYF